MLTHFTHCYVNYLKIDYGVCFLTAKQIVYDCLWFGFDSIRDRLKYNKKRFFINYNQKTKIDVVNSTSVGSVAWL